MPENSRRAPERRPEKTRRIKFRLAYLILIMALGLFTFKFLEKTQEIRSLARQASALRYINQQTYQQNVRLAAQIHYYRTNDYVKNAARDVLGLTDPGEVAVNSRPVHPAYVPVARMQVRPAPSPPAVWKQWWQTFFD